jgi:hypothetical protein
MIFLASSIITWFYLGLLTWWVKGCLARNRSLGWLFGFFKLIPIAMIVIFLGKNSSVLDLLWLTLGVTLGFGVFIKTVIWPRPDSQRQET